ncbi:MAG TPA: glutathione S-transferase family protein, partial [Stellaceae bacterium]|nr:glutathione S-transferase family protein [Stellaceae bacterium]
SLAQHNPRMKIPALVLDDGSSLMDSPLICEYLDSLHDGRKLFPSSGPERWTALRILALGDGVCDAVLLRRYEMVRPEAYCWPDQLAKQTVKINQGLAQLDRDAAGFRAEPTIGEIAVACTLGYLDLRFSDDGWRDRCPNLAHWYAGFGQRPSMRATEPPKD